jgi:hypothetical protein
MTIDFGIVGPLVRTQVIPEAQPACAQEGRNDQRQDQSDRTTVESTAVTSGIPCAGVVTFVLVDLISDLCLVRLRSPLKRFLLVEHLLNFKPQPLNFFVKALLSF